MRHLHLPCRDNKVHRIRRVELEHFKMAGNDEACSDIFCELRRLPPAQIACYAPFGFGAIDWEKGEIDRKLTQEIRHFGIPNRVATVVHRPTSELYDITQKLAAA